MKILAIEHECPGISENAFTPDLLRQEATHAWELYQNGVIRELCFRQDRHEAVLALECADAAEAQAFLETLPLVQAKLITFELIPLGPYPGFARLFAPA